MRALVAPPATNRNFPTQYTDLTCVWVSHKFVEPRLHAQRETLLAGPEPHRLLHLYIPHYQTQNWLKIRLRFMNKQLPTYPVMFDINWSK